MIATSFNFLMPGMGPAGLPLPATAEALPEPVHHVGRPEVEEAASAIALRDPGSIEFESWAAYLRHSVR